MRADQMMETLEAIFSHNPQADVILDTVYLRTLSTEDATALMEPLSRRKDLLERIIFLESFSKSHGLCRERLALYFSASERLFTECHTSNIAFSSGPGAYKDFQFDALGSMSREDQHSIRLLHEFWRDERKGLLAHLAKPQFSHLFEKEQPHIRSDDIDHTCTLYICLKARPQVTAQQVFRETGALGVDTKRFHEGNFIRFAVATIRKPTYSNLLK